MEDYNNLQIVDLDKFLSASENDNKAAKVVENIVEKHDNEVEEKISNNVKVEKLEKELADVKTHMIELDIENQHLKQAVLDYEHAEKIYQDQVNQLNADLEGLRADNTAVGELVNQKQEQCDNLDSELDRTRENLQSVEELNRQLKIKLEECQNELLELKNTSKNREDEATRQLKDYSEGLAIYRDALIRLCRDVR